LESLRSGLLAQIESLKACDGHREALVIDHIKQRVAELENIQSCSKQVDHQSLLQKLAELEYILGTLSQPPPEAADVSD